MSGRADIRKLYSLGPSTNIFSTPLPDGSIYPDHLYEHDPRPADFLRNFDRVRTKPWDECVFLDLGCNEGSSTFLLAESGARVLGIEGRGDAVKRARVIRDALSFDHVDFLCGDVLDRSLWQEVDAVYAAGILYHLSEPFEFLELVNEYCRDYVYICTHFAPSTATELRNATLAHRIKAAHRLEYKGRKLLGVDFAEPEDVNETTDHGRRHPRSGVGITTALWLTASGLTDVMDALGFTYSEGHELFMENLRHRRSFFRSKPERDVSVSLERLRPLPERTDRAAATEVAYERDISFLESSAHDVVVVGDPDVGEPILRTLSETGIDAGTVWGARYDRNVRDSLVGLARGNGKGRRLNIVLAFQHDLEKAYHQVMLLDLADYVFTSFALRSRSGSGN